MVRIEIPWELPETEQDGSARPVQKVIEESGQLRLSELRERCDQDDLAHDLLELVESGDIALLPIGDVVVVRSES